MQNNKTNKEEYIITLLSKDRPGIISDVSNAIKNSGGNISHVSQTVLKGYFTIIIFAAFPDRIDKKELADYIASLNEGYHVNVVPYDSKPSFEQMDNQKYILTIKCTEQEGIISEITSYLYHKNINIEDFYAYIHQGTPLMIAQIAVPTDAIADTIRKDIEELGKKWNLSVNMSHENIYIATNTICSTAKLIKGGD